MGAGDPIFLNGSDILSFWLIFWIIFGLGFKFSKQPQRYTNTTKKKYSNQQNNSTIVSSDDDIVYVKSKISLDDSNTSNTAINHDYDDIHNDTWCNSKENLWKIIPNHIPAYPSNWVFPVAWTILYAFLVASIWLCFQKIQFSVGFETDCLVLFYAFHVVMLLWWYPCFFDAKQSVLAELFLIGIIITSLCILGFLGNNGDLWISFTFQLALTLWCMFALYLNTYWIYVEYRLIPSLK